MKCSPRSASTRKRTRASAAHYSHVSPSALQRLDGANDIYKMLTYITIGCGCVYPLVWILGSEGTASLGLTQEV